MSEETPEIKRLKTYMLRLTQFELLHIRDVLSISLPLDGKRTVSQALAESENRTMIEAFLWKKVLGLCNEAGLPTGDDAPDYIVAPAGPPPMSVYMLAPEPTTDEECDEDEECTGVFDSDEEGESEEL